MEHERTTDETRERLKLLRQGLLRLHKTLLDLERRDFERARGRIGNSYEFLQLVLKDPWFDWLHRLSELIVQIDETLDPNAETPATEADATALFERAKALLAPAETGSGTDEASLFDLFYPDIITGVAVDRGGPSPRAARR